MLSRATSQRFLSTGTRCCQSLRRQWPTYTIAPSTPPPQQLLRLALSNYLLQTLIGTSIFFGWGLGLGLVGSLHEWQTLLIALLIIYLQIKISAWWLSRYRYGPLEWAWRCGTYFKGIPFKVERSAGSGK
ncbi:DUF418 domain-containing protein [Gilvimarinus sp. SDUM040013]|nr:DUF418 domain-containing protein [Gilvimarinus sp. SDUM040013]MDO3384765.1 DUF418 domain-containing protein [Gilvimarinus sp. SDUM040013]